MLAVAGNVGVDIFFLILHGGGWQFVRGNYKSFKGIYCLLNSCVPGNTYSSDGTVFRFRRMLRGRCKGIYATFRLKHLLNDWES